MRSPCLICPIADGRFGSRRSRSIVSFAEMFPAFVQSPCSPMRTRPVCGLSIVNVLSALTNTPSLPGGSLDAVHRKRRRGVHAHDEQIVAEQAF